MGYGFQMNKHGTVRGYHRAGFCLPEEVTLTYKAFVMRVNWFSKLIVQHVLLEIHVNVPSEPRLFIPYVETVFDKAKPSWTQSLFTTSNMTRTPATNVTHTNRTCSSNLVIFPAMNISQFFTIFPVTSRRIDSVWLVCAHQRISRQWSQTVWPAPIKATKAWANTHSKQAKQWWVTWQWPDEKL